MTKRPCAVAGCGVPVTHKVYYLTALSKYRRPLTTESWAKVCPVHERSFPFGTVISTEKL